MKLATALKQYTRHWKQHDLTWDGLITWLELDEPADHKECGGYVLGELSPTTQQHYKGKLPDGDPCTALHRSKEAVVSRSAVALDADKAASDFFDTTCLAGTAMVLYTTWSHTPDEPRYRLLIPLDRDVTAVEYSLIVQALMSDLGAEQFDAGSAQAERLMYRPSTRGDGSYWYEIQDGIPLQADVWLERAYELGYLPTPERPKHHDTSSVRTQPGIHLHARVAIDAALARLVDCSLEGWAGEGWDNTTFEVACELVEYANSNWTGYTLDDAEADLLAAAPADEHFGYEQHMAKLASALRTVDGGSKPEPSTPGQDFSALPTQTVDVTNAAKAFEWLRQELGMSDLSGYFLRGSDVVFTPRVGDEGYRPPTHKGDDDGPAQVQRVGERMLAASIDTAYKVVKSGGRRGSRSAELFPYEVAARALSISSRLPNLRPLRAVTHTPTVRDDGSVLDQPGYDDASSVLYLPQKSVHVPCVPDAPRAHEVEQALKLVRSMVEEFPWESPHDEANFLAALLTPLLRQLVPPPYKLVVIQAPQRGSGKSLLASLMRIIHGGVFKSEYPRDSEEQRKVITAILDTTSAPVIQFDNVTGVVRSSVLDGLLTSAEWIDRVLGSGRMTSALVNDRLWVVTGNNVRIGGDLSRRTLWVTINANTDRPEERTDFRIQDLENWARARRGDILHALLVLIRGWVVQGMPADPAPTSDSFGHWTAVARGILGTAGLEGVVGHEKTRHEEADEDGDEWGTFLAAAHRTFGSEPWLTSELLERARWNVENEPEIKLEDLPGDVAERMGRSEVLASKSLGRWLSNRTNTWAQGYVLRMRKPKSAKHSKAWYVEAKSGV